MEIINTNNYFNINNLLFDISLSIKNNEYCIIKVKNKEEIENITKIIKEKFKDYVEVYYNYETNELIVLAIYNNFTIIYNKNEFKIV